MVNHVRTLLLNSTASSVYDISTIYVPADFKPVTLDGKVLSVGGLLFPASLSLMDRVTLVDNLMHILHTGELEPYTLRFDSRITYIPNASLSLYDLAVLPVSLRTTLTSLLDRVGSTVVIGGASTDLFQWAKYSTDMAAFSKTWTTSPELVLRLGALVLAYAYQVEKLRSNA